MKLFNFDEFLNESTLWDDHKELPSIFNQTIYRLPTAEELKEFEKFNLTGREVVQGFNYTIVGRGIKSPKSRQMIIDSIQSLCEMYPDNKEYKAALTEAKYADTLQSNI